MIVTKGGISRNIDDRRLAEYKAKGYAPAKEKPGAKKEGAKDDDKKE